MPVRSLPDAHDSSVDGNENIRNLTLSNIDRELSNGMEFHSKLFCTDTVYPRSSEPIYIVSYYIKRGITSWTYSISLADNQTSDAAVSSIKKSIHCFKKSFNLKYFF